MWKKIFYNGTIVTMDDNSKTAEAVLVEDDKIIKVGTKDDIFALKDDKTLLHDLEGKTLLPGFIDPHSHLTAVAYNLLMVNAAPSPIGECDSVEALIDEFKKGLEESSLEEGDWLMGMGYDNSAFEDGRQITKLDLDKVSTDIPITCIHASGHCSVFNSKALEILGYTKGCKDPEGGTIERFPGTDEPNGLCTEKAVLSLDVQSKMKAPSFERVLNSIKKACSFYSSFGITTAQDAKVTADREYPLLQAAAKSGALNIDIVGYAAEETTDVVLEKGMSLCPPYKDHFRVGGCKLFLDGSPQAKTAWLSQPYFIAPEGKEADYKGFPVQTEEHVLEVCQRCADNNWQLNVHCNGDEAIEQFIRCYTIAKEKSSNKTDLRPVCVHCQTVREDQLDRMKEIGMLPTYFLDHIYYWGDYHYESVLGAERAERISPAKSTIDRGMTFTMHQDAPVVKPNALFAVHNAVNRITRKGRVLGADQRVSVWEALKAVTIYGAYQIFEEDVKGTITEGKLADLCIVDRNPLEVPSEEIKDIKILETIKEGETIYTAK